MNLNALNLTLIVIIVNEKFVVLKNLTFERQNLQKRTKLEDFKRLTSRVHNPELKSELKT